MNFIITNKKGEQFTVLIDKEDSEEILHHKWCVSLNKGHFYVCRNGRHLYLHHFLIGKRRGLKVDHINGNGLDNRRCNLRFCTHSQNLANSKLILHSSLYRGVTWNKNAKKWAAYVKEKNHTKYLGLFIDEAEAARTYDRAAFRIFGNFARLNFPMEVGYQSAKHS